MDAFALKEETLRIDACMTTPSSSSAMDGSQSDDAAMWGDDAHVSASVHHKMLSPDDIATPTGVEPFFDHGAVFGTPSPIKRASYWNEETLQRFHEANHLRLQQIQQHPQIQQNQQHEPRFEPSNEPCTEEIPWPELVYWLGNSSTGQVECTCASCQFERSQGRVPTGNVHHHPHHPPALSGVGQYAAMPSSVYKRLSAKIPVIAVPRIEGVN
jgi:hypothetical protein